MLSRFGGIWYTDVVDTRVHAPPRLKRRESLPDSNQVDLVGRTPKRRHATSSGENGLAVRTYANKTPGRKSEDSFTDGIRSTSDLLT